MAGLRIRLFGWLQEGALRTHAQVASGLTVAIVAIAFVLGVIGAWDNGTAFVLFILAIPLLALAVFFAVVVLAIDACRRLADFNSRTQQVIAFLLGPAMAVASTLAFLPSVWAGGWLGDLSRLALNYADYEAIIAEARHSQREAWFAESRGITYSVDVGPPVRVAFNPAGFLDNWSGIVFDPTGEVMLADGFDESGKFIAPDRITKIFGGDLMYCRHLWSDYYSCSFT